MFDTFQYIKNNFDDNEKRLFLSFQIHVNYINQISFK